MIKMDAPFSFTLLIHDALLYVFNATSFDDTDLLNSMKNATELKVC